MELGAMLVEDSYGYVEPVRSQVSKDIMKQLPSNQLEIQDTDSSEGSNCHRRSLKRCETRYKTMKKVHTLRKVAFKKNSENLNDDVEKVYEILTSDPDFEEDDLKANLRDLYQSLTVKRMVKAKFRSEQERKYRLESIDCCSRLQYNIAILWQKIKYGFSDLSYSLELWHGIIKKIQGHSGSGVASYFIFLRWLLYLNIFNFIMSFGFIVTPQLINEKLGNFSKPVGTNVSFKAYDIFTGSGWLGNSSAFYGYYTSEVIEVANGYQYNMPMAYLFTVGVAAVINLIVVAYSITRSYQDKYVDSSGDINNVCGKVFCAWDFSIEKFATAELRHCLIYQEFKELLSNSTRNKSKITCCSFVEKIVVCLAVNVFVIFAILGIGYLVYLILESKAVEIDIEVLDLLMLALTVTAISFIFHHVISYATKLEYFFSHQVQLYLLLGRVAALRIVILSVLVYFWMVVYVPGPNDTRCYESLFGEEIYRLILLNFLMNLIFCTFFGEFFRKFISKWFAKGFVEVPKFDVAYNTNDLLYYQNLVWIGAFYSPMLPLVMCLILIFLFYIKFCSLVTNCQPSQKPWSAAEAQTVFLILALTNFLLTTVAVGYTIFRIKPSSTCGPFQNHNTVYGIIADSLPKEQNVLLTAIINYAGSPGLVLTLLLCLGVFVYYARAHSLAQMGIVKRVRQQLILESKDKVFLLHQFESAYLEHLKGLMSSSNATENDPDHKVSFDSKLSAVNQNGDNSTNENTKPTYQGYYTEKANDRIFLPSAIASHSRCDPGYLLADAPANSLPLSDDGEISSPRRKHNFFEVSNNNDPWIPMRKISDFSMQEKPSPNSRFKKCDSASPRVKGSPGLKKQGQLLPQPVHKQGFQYLMRGEPSPPRLTGLSKIS